MTAPTVAFILLLSIGTSLLSSCGGRQVQVLQDGSAEGEIFVEHWKIVGPFQFEPSDIGSDPGHGGLHHDYLADLGCPELTCNFKEAAPHLSALTSEVTSENGAISFDQSFPHFPYGVAYAYARFTVQKRQNLLLSVGSGDGVEVWLDHKFIFGTSDSIVRAATRYANLLPVELDKGSHFLLFKVDHKEDDWALICSLLTRQLAAKVAMTNSNGSLVRNRLFVSSHLELTLPAADNGDKTRLHVRDVLGNIMVDKTYVGQPPSSISLPRLPPGIYTVDFASASGIAKDTFSTFTLDQLRKMISCNKAEIHYHNSSSSLALAAVVERFNLLYYTQHFHPLDADWQKKILLTIKQLVEIRKCQFSSACPQFSGFSLQRYISSVDGTPQTYMIYLPHSQKPILPVVMIVPYAERPNRPFLESSLLAWPNDLTSMAEAADANGDALIVANGRGTVGDSPIGQADLLDTLTAAEHIIPTDKDRVYLFGVCEGGRRALLLAEHFPQLFAGIGVYGPELSRYKLDPGSDKWFSQNDVLSLAPNLSNIPIDLVYGDLDDQLSWKLTKKFVQTVKTYGGTIRETVIRGGMHKQENLEKLIFPSFLNLSRTRSPRTVHVVSSDNQYTEYWLTSSETSLEGESPAHANATIAGNTLLINSTGVYSIKVHGPLGGLSDPVKATWNGQEFNLKQGLTYSQAAVKIARSPVTAPLVADVFGSPFIAVLGSRFRSDSMGERAFLKRWRDDFFSSCPHVRDFELSPLMARSYNLVFVGRQRTDSLAALIAAKALSTTISRLRNSAGRSFRVASGTNPTNHRYSVVYIIAQPRCWNDRRFDVALGGRYRNLVSDCPLR